MRILITTDGQTSPQDVHLVFQSGAGECNELDLMDQPELSSTILDALGLALLHRGLVQTGRTGHQVAQHLGPGRDGAGALKFLEARSLPLSAVAGQIATCSRSSTISSPVSGSKCCRRSTSSPKKVARKAVSA